MAVEPAVEAVAEAEVDPEDVEEVEAGEDLVVVAPGARISRIFPTIGTHFKSLSRHCCISIKECSLIQVVLYFLYLHLYKIGRSL